MADFVIADVTDSMLDGYISGFPNTYATKVGKTSDEMYKACFGSVMSMMCSSLFPRCSVPQATDLPGGCLRFFSAGNLRFFLMEEGHVQATTQCFFHARVFS